MDVEFQKQVEQYAEHFNHEITKADYQGMLNIHGKGLSKIRATAKRANDACNLDLIHAPSGQYNLAVDMYMMLSYGMDISAWSKAKIAQYQEEVNAM